MVKNIKEMKQYLNDLDNLIDTGYFKKESVKDYTFYHKDLTLVEFIQEGRELIRQSLMAKKLEITIYDTASLSALISFVEGQVGDAKVIKDSKELLRKLREYAQ